jgi:hypothetical protein
LQERAGNPGLEDAIPLGLGVLLFPDTLAIQLTTDGHEIKPQMDRYVVCQWQALENFFF